MQYLYRHFDKDGKLLYVGISNNWAKRTGQHSHSARWFDLVKNVTIETFETRRDVVRAESQAIASENPEYNIIRPSVTSIVRNENRIKQSERIQQSESELITRIVGFDLIYHLEDIARILGCKASRLESLCNSGDIRFIERQKEGVAPKNGLPFKPKKLITGWALIEFFEAIENGDVKL